MMEEPRHPAVDYQVQNSFGVTPGSSRYGIVERSWPPLSDQQSNAINVVHTIAKGTAVDGKGCFVEFVCTARNEDGSPIVEADQIALEHGAGALLISDITVQVGSQPSTHVARNDLTRYVYDVFGGEQKRKALGGSNYYPDREAGVLTVTNPAFKSAQKQILDDREFKLVLWLDHLPQFGQSDPHIPGPSIISLDIQFSPTFSRLFKSLTGSPKVTTKPKLYISKARIHFRTATVDPLKTLEIATMLASPEGIAYNTIVNKAVAVQPGVKSGTFEYSTNGVPTEVPADELLRQVSMFMIDSVRTNLSVPYMNTRWNYLKQATLNSESGQVLRQWRDIEDGKVAMFAEFGARAVLPAVGSEGSPQYPFDYWRYDQLDIADQDEGALYAYLTGWFDDEIMIQAPQFARMSYDLSFLGTVADADVIIVTSTHKIARITL